MAVEPASNAPRGPSLGARVPDFFIAGHPKCGTTAMYEMLRRHPQIFMPDVKEPRYFASDMRRRFQPRGAGALPETLPDYLALFASAPADKLVGEASPSYLTSRTAAGLIAELAPAAKIIAILREPASFLRSLHLQLVQSHVESVTDLRTALALEPERRAGRRVPRRSHRPAALMYSDNVRYVEQLRRYEAVFPKEQILVLIYDDFRADNRAVLTRVLRFLGVREDVDLGSVEINPTIRVRSQGLDELVQSVAVGRGGPSRAAKAVVKSLTPARARSALAMTVRRRVVLGAVHEPDGRLMAELRRTYAPEVRALSDHLGRDLVSLWGYDDLA